MNPYSTENFVPHRLMLTLLVLGGLLGSLTACSAPPGSATFGGGDVDGDTVVAEVGGEPLTMADLEKKAAPQLEQLEVQRQKILEATLGQLVEDKLVEVEADARGLSPEKLIETEVDGKLAPVTNADVDTWYEANRLRVGKPKDQVAAQIRQHLEQQGRSLARANLQTALRLKHPVKFLMEPARAEVDIAGAPTKGGDDDAPVTLIEFSDFECPFCGRINPTVAQVMETYGDKVRVAFRHFPLAMHPNAPKAAEASLCANDQDRFWEMHDKLFDHQKALSVDALKGYATELGLDGGKFAECLDSSRYAEQVQKDMADGQAAGVTGTPAVFVNGRMLSGAQPFEEFAKIIDDELQRRGV